jgi:AraC-like DNA-binding protein
LAKIAVLLDDAVRERERLGAAPALSSRLLAEGDGWVVEDVICTYRPSDASFEERHDRYRAALVGFGTFQCRSAAGRELLTPGSWLLGNARDCFECGHEHGAGDRCLAFGYAPEMFERLAFEAGVRGKPRLKALRVPPLAVLAPLVGEACATWAQADAATAFAVWQELGVRVAAAAVRLAAEPCRAPRSPANAERGVARAVRLIERDPRAPLALAELAREARLSRFHLVRAFARFTGLTPHRYVKRARLRRAAVLLATRVARIIDVAMTSGFRDVSSFNHAYRAEFGATPSEHRERLRRAKDADLP